MYLALLLLPLNTWTDNGSKACACLFVLVESKVKGVKISCVIFLVRVSLIFSDDFYKLQDKICNYNFKF